MHTGHNAGIISAILVFASLCLSSCKPRSSDSTTNAVVGVGSLSNVAVYAYMYTFNSPKFAPPPGTRAYNAFCIYRYVAEGEDPRTPEARFALAAPITTHAVDYAVFADEMRSIANYAEDRLKRQTPQLRVVVELLEDEQTSNSSKNPAQVKGDIVSGTSLIDVFKAAARHEDKSAEKCPIKHPQAPEEFRIIPARN